MSETDDDYETVTHADLLRVAYAERDEARAEVERLRGLLRAAHRELSTIEAITVSPSDTDGLIALVKKIEEVL